MKVNSGEFRGRKLSVPSGIDIRPTSDKVRQAIFNILNSSVRIQGEEVLDLYCGSGALGIEALSRGASKCLFIDKRKESLNCTKKNLETLSVDPDRFQLIQKDVLKLTDELANKLAAGLVFLDPPYRKDIVMPSMKALRGSNALKLGAVCLIECEKEFTINEMLDFKVFDQREYGDTKVIFCRYK
jgi:16S rRNA (guanine966-N2)-methyltransferase